MNADTQSQHISFAESHARRVREIQLPEGARLVEYVNGNDRVFYENDQLHTLSLYLVGGYETWRTDTKSQKGAPGHFCLMPKDSYSAWNIGSEQNFAHLYFTDDYLKRIALTTFDMDPRRVELPQLTYSKDAALEAIFRHSILNWDWQSTGSAMALEQGAQTLLVNLIQTLGVGKTLSASLTGGLSPVVQARVREFIDANLHRQILLLELADLAELSEYHFARMFKVSFAQTPQQYITRQRVERAKQLLCLPEARGLSDIALACGFSSQSHLGRAFKQYLGVTPGAYRKVMGKR